MLIDNKEFVVVINSNKNTNYSRAGDYVSHNFGSYQAFVPKPLPPNPPVQLDRDDDFVTVTSRYGVRAFGWNEYNITKCGISFVAMYVNKEADTFKSD